MRGISFAPYGLLLILFLMTIESTSEAARNLIIATSPTVKDAIVALGHAFERSHEGVRVQVAVDTSLDLRRTIAGMENRGKAFIGSGPIHLVAPGGDELITRLEMKYYVLPEARALYATERLVLVAPESLIEAPESFAALASMEGVRIAVADGTTRLGVETARLLSALDLKRQQLHVASDTAGILDHVLSGQADVGIMFGHDAARAQHRVRVLAEAPSALYQPVPHSVAMERYCPDRQLCQEFLRFVTSPEGQSVVKQLGYGPGKQPETPVTVSGQ
jgi:molybdate transport system substrate-binding protein